ncbi:hypothetical protein DBV15_11972 [Temnothorax longispinosus]|uniref:Reverse transcriptase domain-containing protein n=1 Tax=Temnothorax longispinosus TaxID=300112 RepID=A0A4S2KIU5_9HYME|nr:hypothetical protein DBV15_11972 [Temnothorax longispinosus]
MTTAKTADRLPTPKVAEFKSNDASTNCSARYRGCVTRGYKKPEPPRAARTCFLYGLTNLKWQFKRYITRRFPRSNNLCGANRGSRNKLDKGELLVLRVTAWKTKMSNTEMEGLIRSQNELHGRIARAYDNLKKAGSARFTMGLVDARLQALESNWSKFEEQHSKLLLMPPETLAATDYKKQDLPTLVEETFAYNQIASIIKSCITEALGKNTSPSDSPIKSKFHPAPWWNDECETVIKARRTAQKNFKAHYTLETLIEYKKSIAVARRVLREQKVKGWKNFCATFNAKTPIDQVWRMVKSFRRRDASQPINDPLKEEELIQAAINKLCPPSCSPDDPSLAEMSATDALNMEHLSAWMDGPISMQEIKAALKTAKLKSSPDSMVALTNNIKAGFLKGAYTVAAFLDIDGAFDNVQPHILDKDLRAAKVPAKFRKFVMNLISNRLIYYVKSGRKCGPMFARKGTPQGSILSPTLFNIYIKDIVKLVNPDCQILLYADDVVVYSTNKNLEDAVRSVNESIQRITDFLSGKDVYKRQILRGPSHLTRLIVEACHRRTLHGGVQMTLGALRQEYWVPRGRTLVKGCIRRCVTCVRWRAASPQPVSYTHLDVYKRQALFHARYTDFMRQYVELGHMTPVDPPVNPTKMPVCYLPHHGVMKETSATTKLRVVFNGSSALPTGATLNKHLQTGPNLLPALVEILLRWRCHRFVFAADIEKMYRQIEVHPEDRDLQRIIWRESPSDILLEFLLITYGLACSAFLAIRTLHQLAKDEGVEFPLGAIALLLETYCHGLHGRRIDDMWTSITISLNATGNGPQKQAKEWQKTWRDWKSNVLKKCAQNKSYAGGTSGGLPKVLQLTELEESLLEILDPEAAGLADIPEAENFNRTKQRGSVPTNPVAANPVPTNDTIPKKESCETIAQEIEQHPPNSMQIKRV